VLSRRQGYGVSGTLLVVRPGPKDQVAVCDALLMSRIKGITICAAYFNATSCGNGL
jgi:hypothetical protein